MNSRRKFIRSLMIGSAFPGVSPIFAASWRKMGGSTTVPSGVRIGDSRFPQTMARGPSSSLLVRSDGALLRAGSLYPPNNLVYVAEAGISNVKGVSIGHQSYSYLDGQGNLFSMGDCSYGQLGGGLLAASVSTWVQATGVSGVLEIANSVLFTVARQANGDVYGVGYALSGRFGSGNSSNRSTFVKAIGISQAIAISCARAGTLALRADGMVYSSGYHAGGGRGNTATTSTFTQALGISQCVAIACGYFASFAVRSDGLVFATGSNNTGQLGDGTTVNRSTFIQMIGISDAIAVAAIPSKDSVYALRSDGLVFACGSNGGGELGDNTTIDRSSFVQAIGISQVAAIAYGFAVQGNGQVYAVGFNQTGQLGDGTVANRSSFVKVY